MLLEIRLHGDLTDFGTEWHLDAHTPLEALHAIDANSPGFFTKFRSGKYAIIALPVGQEEITDEEQIEVIDEDRCHLPISNKQVLHILPVPEGEYAQAVYWVSYGIMQLGVSQGVAIAVGTFIVNAAITYALVSAANYLMPAPPGLDSKAGDPSYHFSGPVNTSKQGAAVPLLYGGPLLVGSQVIGQSIVAEDIPTGDKKLRSRAYSELVDVISEGPIEGYVNADLESSVYLDGTPFRITGRDTQAGFEAEFLQGTQDQSFADMNLSKHPGTSSVRSVGILMRNDTGPLYRTTQSPNVGRISITINIPNLVKTKDNGHRETMWVSYRVSIKGQGVGSFVTVINDTVEGKVLAGYYRTKSFNIKPAHGTYPFQIKVERTKADNDKASVQDSIYWTSYTETVVSNLAYPNSALVVSKFDAEKFSSLPTRGFLMKGVQIQIPSNYDPIARTYNGAWDGLFNPTLTWTNNPAWIYYDLATNPRYGLGEYLTEDLIDKWALYSIAQYCDALVPDGYGAGGTEPRFVCNLYLQNKAEALSVLRDLASAFRSIMFWANGLLIAHQDSPSTAVAQYTPSNIIGGAFNYTGTPKHSRYTVALVTWSNPDDNYQAWVEYVEDREGIELYGVKETSITAVGCTSRGQAHRTGKYALLVSKLETDAVAYKCGLDALTVKPGDVAKIVDPLHNQSDESVGGRLSSTPTLSSVVLDRPVTLGAGTYHITITMPDTSQSSHQVSNGAGTVTPPTAITFTPALATTPVDGAVWSITDDAESERLYRILTVSDNESSGEGFYELSGIRYIEDVLTQADDPGELDLPDVPGTDDGLSAPIGLRLEEVVIAFDSGIKRSIEASWGAPSLGFVDYYQLTIYQPHTSDIVLKVYETEYQLENIVPGEYAFEVRAVNTAGQISTAVTAAITINELAPIDLLSITGLELFGQGNDTVFEGKAAEFTWRLTSLTAGDLGDETFGGDTGITDPWFMDYEVTISDQYGVELRVDHVTDRNYVYTYEKNLEDGGPRRTIEVSVAARDIYNRKTEESYLEVYNPPPQGYTSVTFTAGIALVVVAFTPPQDNDFVGTRVHVSQLNGFTPDETTVMYDGSDTYAVINNLTAEQYYILLEGVDAFGNSGIYSQQYSVVLQTVDRIHDQLAGQIQESWLYSSLNDRIDKIDEPVIGLWDRVDANETAITDLQAQGFESIMTYHQPTDPQLDAHPPTLLEGDLWIDSSSGDTIKRWNGTAWDTLESGGNQVFYGDGPPDSPFTGQSPDPGTLVTGDYWVDTHDYGDGLGPANIPWMWNGSAWVNISQGLLNATAATLSTVEAQVNDPVNNTSALSVWLDSVEVQATTNGTNISANVDAINYINAEIGDPDNGTSAMATYLQALNFDVYDQAGKVEVNAGAVTTLSATVDTKVSTYYQTDDPANNVPAPVLVDGDLWIDTDDQNHMFRYSAGTSSWIDARDSSATGATTWVANGVPDPNDSRYTTGDIYYQIDDNYKPWRFDGSVPEWVSVRDTATSGVTTNVGNGVPDDNGPYNTGDLYFDAQDNNHPYRYETSAWVDIAGAAGIQTYYQDTEPTGGTYNEGDLWFETDQGNQVYRYDGVTPWLNIQDADIAQALSDAADAQTTADGKMVAFYQDDQPSGVGEVEGDFWVDTNDGNKLYRYTTGAWVVIQDAGIQTALTNASTAQTTADGKIVTFFQIDPPAGAHGDLWFDTDDDNHPYRYDTTNGWESVLYAAPLGIKNYFQADEPTGGSYIEGDMWFETDNNNHPYRYNGATWDSVKDTSVPGLDTFYQTTAPVIGMTIGDLWFDTDDNNRVYRFTGSLGLWQEVINGEFSGVVPYVQPNEPIGGTYYVGDLWIDDDDENRVYEWQGSSWVDIITTPPTITTTAAVAVEQHARVQQDGLAFAEYTMKVDVNGHVAGIGLGVSGGASGPIRSEIVMLADSFAIGFPTTEFETNYTYAVGDWVTPTQAYIDANGTPEVQPDGETLYRWDYVYKVTTGGFATSEPPTWPTTPGVSVFHGARFECRDKVDTTPFIVGTFNSGTDASPVYEDGVIINKAHIGTATIDHTHIKNATITTAEIADLAVTTAKIADLDVTGAKIADATIGTGKIINASISNAKIGTYIQSDDFVDGSAGWRLHKTSGFQVNTGNFKVSQSGAVTIKSGSSGERMELYNDVLKVFDASGTLRVKLGDLTS